MIRVSAMYPKQEGGHFDHDYYVNKHMPLVFERLGDSIKKVEVYKGTSGMEDSPESFITVTNFWFESVPAFEEAFFPHIPELMGDFPNYTNIEPIIQIEELLLSKD